MSYSLCLPSLSCRSGSSSRPCVPPSCQSCTLRRPCSSSTTGWPATWRRCASWSGTTRSWR
uniref:Uncharacterized protein n=1 Tax=Catagonus wagneri TaxID=51154 RepID=A0A8C3VL32_9CETA